MKFTRRKVQKGKGIGRKLGFPTVNLNVGSFGKSYKQGVYTCTIRISEKEYKGMLFFGLRMHSKKPSLEIHILNFSGNLYGEHLSFSPQKQLRNVIYFESSDKLKKQIEKDLEFLR